jgi:uncharacterized protein
MHEQYALAAADLDFLRDFLDSDANENGLDFAGTHGFLCAVTVGPAFVSANAWLAGLFDEAPITADAAVATRVQELLADWQRSIHATLYHGQAIALPCPLHADVRESTPLTDWCIGFMEAMFAQEEDWYAADEDLIADLTLPMVVISELIDDDEVAAIRRDKKILKELAGQIPEVVTELYLLFHAPANP